ncbi:MAG: hydrogenase maturation protease [Candidatus Omnitrophota bacterium]|nr:MAG: hydrogenase maturation protease [Candidatus Omnitrophota bacterium]
MMKTLVLGIGNTIRGDDSIGIHLARRLREILPSRFAIKELSTAGLDFMEAVSGYRKVFLIDAIHTSQGIAGQVYRLGLEDFAYPSCLSSTHALNLKQVLELGRKLKEEEMPEEIEILAIEAPHLDEFSQDLSPQLAAQFDKIVETVRSQIELGSNK